MSVFAKVASFLSGGIGGKIVDKVLSQFPDKLSDAEKAQVAAAITEATREHEIELLSLAKEQDEQFNRRMISMEGTAKDLQQFGFLGKAIVFLRGAQRPIWGYGVLVMDFMVFSGQWKLTEHVKVVDDSALGLNIESSFWVINFLVLGFLFGERAIKNIAPLVKSLKS